MLKAVKSRTVLLKFKLVINLESKPKCLSQNAHKRGQKDENDKKEDMEKRE